MAEPFNLFFQGANLGMRAGAARTQQEQFRTNLAEKARQFDQSFSLQEEANKAAVARDRAYTQKLNFDLKQQEESNNRITAQLDKLAAYKTSVREAADNYLLKLPLPPSGLQGDILKEAQNYYTTVDQDRQSDAMFKRQVQERDDLSDLIANYGLRSDFVEYFNNFESAKQEGVPYTAPGFNRSSLISPGSRPLFTPEEENPANELKEAFTRRSLARAEVIASEYGVDPMKVSTIDVISPFQDQKGDLDVDRFRAYVSALPEAKLAVSSVTTYPDGRSQKTMRPRSGSSDDNISKLERFMKAAEPLITRKTASFGGTQETLNIPALKSLADQFGIQLTDEIISALSSSAGGGGGGAGVGSNDDFDKWSRQND